MHDGVKNIEVIRFGSGKPQKLYNGDLYDSTLRLRSPDMVSLFNCPHVNTDASKKFRGLCGILAEGQYSGIVVMRKGRKCIQLFGEKYWDLVFKREDITLEYATLPSLIPNPNHKGEKIITWVFIHDGADGVDKNGKPIETAWDWSQGCITIPQSRFLKLMDYFSVNDKVNVNLIRNTSAEVPYWYNVMEG